MKLKFRNGTVLAIFLVVFGLFFIQTFARTITHPSTNPIESDYVRDVQQGEASIINDQEAQENQTIVNKNEDLQGYEDVTITEVETKIDLEELSNRYNDELNIMNEDQSDDIMEDDEDDDIIEDDEDDGIMEDEDDDIMEDDEDDGIIGDDND